MKKFSVVLSGDKYRQLCLEFLSCSFDIESLRRSFAAGHCSTKTAFKELQFLCDIQNKKLSALYDLVLGSSRYED